MKLKLRRRSRSRADEMAEAVEAGILGGLNKARKWGLLRLKGIEGEPGSTTIRLIRDYVLAEIDSRFDL